MRLLGALCFGFSLLIGTACSAATVESFKGTLSINHGQGFEKVNGPIEANAGDTVMVSPDGSAVISYPDGCMVTIQPGAVTTIGDLSPCASGSNAQDQSPAQGQSGTQDQCQFSNSPFCHPGILVAGAVGAGLAGFLIYEVTRPPSPASP